MQITTTTSLVCSSLASCEPMETDEALGGGICSSFIVLGGLSVLLYKPWRRRTDYGRQIRHQPQQLQDDEKTGTVVENEAVTGGKDVRRPGEDSTIEGQSSGKPPSHEAEPHRTIAGDIVL